MTPASTVLVLVQYSYWYSPDPFAIMGLPHRILQRITAKLWNNAIALPTVGHVDIECKNNFLSEWETKHWICLRKQQVERREPTFLPSSALQLWSSSSYRLLVFYYSYPLFLPTTLLAGSLQCFSDSLIEVNSKSRVTTYSQPGIWLITHLSKVLSHFALSKNHSVGITPHLQTSTTSSILLQNACYWFRIEWKQSDSRRDGNILLPGSLCKQTLCIGSLQFCFTLDICEYYTRRGPTMRGVNRNNEQE